MSSRGFLTLGTISALVGLVACGSVTGGGGTGGGGTAGGKGRLVAGTHLSSVPTP